jgi:flagellar motility protein MotE (MotC chaperone)
MLDRLRILPVLIAAATLLFGLKVDDVWRKAGALDVQAALAQPKESKQAEAAPAQNAAAEPAQPTADPAPAPAPARTANFTPAEIEVLQSLAERRRQLDARGRQVEAQEALLKAAEKRVEEKIAELKKLETTIGGLIRQHDEQSEAQLKSLVKVYENMKPKDAARIFEELEMTVLLDVVERMKESKIAPILASMDPAKAKAVTVELATRRKLPESGG